MSELVRIAMDEDQLVSHADWVELQCLLKADHSISREDLARALKRPGFMGEVAARELADETFQELNDRSETLSKAGAGPDVYPYALDGRIEILTYLPLGSDDIVHRLPYMFLLVVSRHSMASSDRKRDGIDPTAVFEQVCAEALKLVLGGDDRCFAYHLGTANNDPAVRDFPTSINSLCEKMSEGGKWKSTATSPGSGDGGVDVVVWRGFRDKRPGNLVGFAQCKTGTNWRDHLGKLRPNGFCGKFMTEPLILEPRSIFMVPHRIRRSIWEQRMHEGGVMLLDRCRIVEYASSLNASTGSQAEKWLRSALASIKASL